MKRQNIITKLMNEGFTQKTLVNLTDKQLHMLAERILSEQYMSTSTTSPASVLNIPKTDQIGINAAKTQKKTFATYEGEVKEQEKLGAPEKKQYSDEEIVMKRVNHKIETKMKKNEGVKSEVELLKRMGKEIPEKVQKYCDARKKKEKEPALSENKKVKKWVNKLVESKCFTSKNEIMRLIHTKLNEQEVAEPETITLPDFLTFDAITSSGEAQPTTKPGTKPTTKPSTRPTPKTPFQPGPGPKHNPKASMEEDKK
jgi:hypothetical protein